MKIYLSCPIARNDRHDDELAAMKNWVQGENPEAEVISPLDIGACEDFSCIPEGTNVPPGKHTWTCYLRHDIAVMVLCDLVVVRENYTNSKGCMAEVRVAWDLGIPVDTLHLSNGEGDNTRIYRRDTRGVSWSDGR